MWVTPSFVCIPVFWSRLRFCVPVIVLSLILFIYFFFSIKASNIALQEKNKQNIFLLWTNLDTLQRSTRMFILLRRCFNRKVLSAVYVKISMNWFKKKRVEIGSTISNYSFIFTTMKLLRLGLIEVCSWRKLHDMQ